MQATHCGCGLCWIRWSWFYLKIDVKGRRGHRSSLFADEFASKTKIYRDALTLMTWQRPYMLGDPEFCSPPDSFGRPIQDRPRLMDH